MATGIKILPCGTDVIILQANITGKITCVAIRFEHVIYEITYYSEQVQQTVWCNECEFFPAGKKENIGFKRE